MRTCLQLDEDHDVTVQEWLKQQWEDFEERYSEF